MHKVVKVVAGQRLDVCSTLMSIMFKVKESLASKLDKIEIDKIVFCIYLFWLT